MKPFGKFLAAALFFSLPAALPVVAVETNDSLLKTLGFPSRAESAISRNLQEAFRQESKDQARYLAFADRSDEEGQPQNAKILRSLASAKQTYVDYYDTTIKQLGGTATAEATEVPTVKSAAENLRSVLESETYKGKTMYPSFLGQPDVDLSSETSKVFEKAKMVAESQARFLQEVLATTSSKIPASAYILCSACGYVFLEWAEVDTCPICGAPKEKFKKLDAA